MRAAFSMRDGRFPRRGLHSFPSSHQQFAGKRQDCLGDLGVPVQQRQARTQAVFGRIFTASDEDRAYFDLANHSTSSYDGGQLAYLLESPPGRCSSPPVPATGGPYSSRSAPTWPSSAPPAAPSWTASPTR